jgi:hypothetical protein
MSCPSNAAVICQQGGAGVVGDEGLSFPQWQIIFYDTTNARTAEAVQYCLGGGVGEWTEGQLTTVPRHVWEWSGSARGRGQSLVRSVYVHPVV